MPFQVDWKGVYPAIPKQFNDDLSSLKNDFLKMGGLVEQQTTDAVNALIDGDGHAADDIRAVTLHDGSDSHGSAPLPRAETHLSKTASVSK